MILSQTARHCGLLPLAYQRVLHTPPRVQVAGLPRTITPPEVLSLFWGWQVRPASTYILAPAHESLHVEVRASCMQASSQQA